MSKKPIKDLEKRLSVAYDSGFFDGYHEGIDDTHQVWATMLLTVRGIGPKRQAAIMRAMMDKLIEIEKQKNMAKNEISQLLDGDVYGTKEDTTDQRITAL